VAALFALPSYGWAQEVVMVKGAAVKDEPVLSIVYEGNKRSKTSVMDRLSGLRTGMRLADIDVDRVRKSFLDSGLFDDATVSYQDSGDGAVVTVRVKERLGLFLIPYNIAISSAYYGGGLLLTDANFLGEQKVGALGVAVSNLGPAGVLSYQDPHFILDHLVLTTYLTGGNQLRQESSMNGDLFAEFPHLFVVQGIQTNYAIDDHWHLLSEVRGIEVSTNNTEAERYGLFERSLVINPSVGFDYSGQTPFEYFLQGPWAFFQYSHGFSFYGLPSYDSVTARGEWTFPALFDGMADAGFSATYGNQTLLVMNALGGKGFRTLPSNSYSDKDLGLYAAYDWPMFHFNWGVIALGGFYEAGFYTTGLDAQPTTEFFQGPGLGVHLFLNKISRSALGVDFSYNVPTRNLGFNVNAGLSFN